MKSQRKKNLTYLKAAELFGALSHPARVRLLHRLLTGDCCVGEIEHCLGISQPNASQHLKILKDAGLVVGTRMGTKICYRLADERLRRVLAAVLEGE